MTTQNVKLPDGSKLILSSSPHISTPINVRNIMLKVCLALLPAALAGICFFGWRALAVIAVTTVSSVLAEAIWCRFAGKPVKGTIADCSAAVTGLLLALNLPPSIPFYVPVIGSFIAIWLGKQVYGGLGNNPFNPAIVARVGLLIAFPAAMTAWTPPRGFNSDPAEVKTFCSAETVAALDSGKPLDAVTCATPLGVVGTTEKSMKHDAAARQTFKKVATKPLLWKYFWGVRPGCIGETCVPALLLGGILLLLFNLINWRVPLCFVGTVFLISGAVHYAFPGVTPPPLFHVLTGGLLIGAIFMATDMVTSPITGAGCVVFAIGCGVITSVIRIWGNYPEGVSFSILFMNALVPLIDRWFGQHPFGYDPRRKKEASK